MKGTVFGGLGSGALVSSAFAAGIAASDLDDRFVFYQATGRLWYDPDGTGAASQMLVATFEQNAIATAADI